MYDTIDEDDEEIADIVGIIVECRHRCRPNHTAKMTKVLGMVKTK